MISPLKAKKVVALTFDDFWNSQVDIVYPMLEEYGFRGTFFVPNEAFKQAWPGLADPAKWAPSMHSSGHEIGHHWHHKEPGCECTIDELNQKFQEIGVPHPVSFCYPMFTAKKAPPEIESRFLVARLGVSGKSGLSGGGAGGGPLHKIGAHTNPLFCTGVFGKLYHADRFAEDVNRIEPGYAGVFCIHQVGQADASGRLGRATRILESEFQRALDILAYHDASVVTLREIRALGSHPVLRSPYRSPVEVSEALRPVMQGKVVCELGCACGDNMLHFLWNSGARRVFGIELEKGRVVTAQERGLEVSHGNFLEPPPVADVYYYWDCEQTHEKLADMLAGLGRRFTFVVGGDPARRIEEDMVYRIVNKHGGRVLKVPYDEGRGRRQSGVFLLGVVEVGK